jgi:hypothetical protein
LVETGVSKTGNNTYGEIFRDLVHMGPTGPFNKMVLELDGRSLDKGFEVSVPNKIISILENPKDPSAVGKRLREIFNLTDSKWDEYLAKLEAGLLKGYVKVTP